MNRKYVLLPSAVLTVLILLSVPFMISITKMSKDSVSRYKHLNMPANKIVNNELNFIRMHSKSGDQCVILSLHQGFYYTVTKMASPIQGPGYIETILEADMANVVKQLFQKKYSCIFIGLKDSAIDLGVDPMKLLKGYNVVSMNSEKTMLYLKPDSDAYSQSSNSHKPLQPSRGNMN